MQKGALAGIRVLDLTQFEAGTTCSGFLGWLGADVIKIEGLRGDQSRANRAEVPGLDSMYFMVFNSSRRSFSIDLKNPEGRELFLKMVPHADVVVENFAPGTMEKLNLDYPVLRKTNRRIIMARIKGFGLSGPYSDFKAFDMIAQAAGGIMSVTGEPDGEPMRAGAAIADTGTGIHTAAAILAAYIQRQATGEGQLVEVSMQEVIANFMRGRYRDHYREGKAAPREGNRLLGTVPSGVYPCAPGGPNDYAYIYVQPLIASMWEGFARAIGREDFLTDPRFGTVQSRYEHRDEINAALTAWTSQRSKQDVMRVLGAHGVACSAVYDTADLLDDPHLNERGSIVTIDHPTRGQFRMPNCPVRLSNSPAKVTAAPLLGQHTDDVLKELFDLSEAEIADLRERKIVR